MSLRRLNPRYVMRRLGRRLEGSFDPVSPTGEYALLHLFNTDQVGRVQEVLENPSLIPGVGQDLIALVGAYIEKLHVEGQESVRCEIDIPRHVWNRYAKRARVDRRRIRGVLADAIVAHDERLERTNDGEHGAIRAIEDLLKKQRDALVPASPPSGGASASAPIVTALDELQQHARHQGTALAALLMIADNQGWIPKRLAEGLRKQKWL